MSSDILIVDDDVNVLRALERLLRRDGHTLHLAESGAAAFQVLEHHSVAVILCDQKMPEMDGATVLAEAYRRQPDTVRIALAAHTDLAAALATVNAAHVRYFLLKPWNDDDLREVMREAVRTHELTSENRRLDTLARQQAEQLETYGRDLERQVAERTLELDVRHRELQELHDCLNRTLRDTVSMIATLLERNDPNVGLHSKRVTELARMMGEELGLSESAMRDLEFTARLHDIGKTAQRYHVDHNRSRLARERARAPRQRLPRPVARRCDSTGVTHPRHRQRLRQGSRGCRRDRPDFGGSRAPLVAGGSRALLRPAPRQDLPRPSGPDE